MKVVSKLLADILAEIRLRWPFSHPFKAWHHLQANEAD
jgi:hypothetical protein